MKNQTIELTDKQLDALVLITQAIEFNADIWSHPKGPRGGIDDDMANLCEYCGKYSKEDEGETFSVLTSGIILPNRVSEDTIWELYEMKLIEDQPQGAMKIGSTCAKKLLGKKLKFYLDINHD